MTDKEKLIINHIEKVITTEGVSNEFLIQLIELGGNYLNIATIADYAKKQ